MASSPHLKTLCLLLVLCCCYVVSGFDPKVVSTELGEPKGLIYFEDSKVVIYLHGEDGVLSRSEDGGKTWKTSTLDKKLRIVSLYEHPFDKDRAYALSDSNIHFGTRDRGASWFRIKFQNPSNPSGTALSFNAQNPDFMLYAGYDCPHDDVLSSDCVIKYYYSVDGFKSTPRHMIDAHKCVFAHSTKDFEAGDYETVVCSISEEDDSVERKLLVSSDWFKHSEYAELDGQIVSGVIGFGASGKYLVAAYKSPENPDELDLLVSVDLKVWDKAEFPESKGKIRENEFTVLESSSHSLHVDLLLDGSSGVVGDFYTSNSNGTYFQKSLEHTNRNIQGLIAMEALQSVEGILISNVVINFEDVKNEDSDKIIRTKISFDDGRTWNYLKLATGDCEGTDSCGLNIHSVLDKNNIGRMFSSPAPGVIAGVGNTGKELKDLADGDLYFSYDSGLTWSLAKEGSHKYEFGDHGNVIVAVPDNSPTDKAYYTVNRGKDWNEIPLGVTLDSRLLFTTPDSTILQFILTGFDGNDKYQSIFIDLEGIFSKKCVFKDDNTADFEKWYGRYNHEKNPSCLMGHKQFFYRKKPKAECYVGLEFKEEVARDEDCVCAEEDYECGYNFLRDDSGKCVPSSAYQEDKSACKSATHYLVSSGYSLIPGNTCKKDGGVVLDSPKEISCDGTGNNGGNNGGNDGNSGSVASIITEFPGYVVDYIYLKPADKYPKDETIVLRTNNHDIYLTHDQGATWDRIAKDSEVLAVYSNHYFPESVYLITSKNEIIYSHDGGHNFKTVKAPSNPNNRGISLLGFHPTKRDWFIWMGDTGCDNPYSPSCVVKGFYTKNGGSKFQGLLEDVQRCSFVGGLLEKTGEDLVYCDENHYEGDSSQRQLVYSTNYFKDKKVAFDNIIGFALENEFLVVATIDPDGKSLKAFVSVDGNSFAHARFPSNLHVDHQQAYTILESVTHAVFLHVTVNARAGSEYGSLLKSNSNGTDYVLSLDEVNRNNEGFVDFEKIQGLEGVAIVNVVDNPDEALSGNKKKLKSKITHNDGGEWSYISPPSKDSEGKKFGCSGGLNKCSLNLHGYTERVDYRDTFSSQSAVGMMIGVGNVGESLTPLHDGDTFMTRDGGVTWKEIRKGAYMWEYGDQGSILVIVNGRDSTNVLYYSTDEGDTWIEYKFSDDLVRVDDIATVLSDNSRKFLLVGKSPLSKGEQSMVIQVDFSGLTDKQCVLDEQNPENDDFELWSPSHPFQANGCLFGHVTQYYRKLKESDCFIGREILKPYATVRNCSCERQDFECDFNYYRDNDGTCKLVAGFSPPDHSLVCSEMPGSIEYWEPTGYRRVPLTTCQGGKELDKVVSHACPGKEKDYYNRQKGLHGFALFFVIVLPIGMTAVIGYVIWDNYTKRYGQIRLGEDEDDQPLAVKIFVVTVAGVVAGVSVLPQLFNSAYSHIKSWFKRSTRFTSRSSFARGREYTIVNADDDELLGIDEDD